MRLHSWVRGRRQIVDHKAVRDVVHQRHEEHQHYQSEEEFVVRTSNAVVEPAAVVVEFVDAAVAASAMLRSVVHVRLADLTLKLIIAPVEMAPSSNQAR